MSYYLLQASYRSESWKAQLRKPQSVIDRLKPVIQSMGGRIESAFFTFGEYDVVLVMELPDNVSAAAFAMIGAAGGALSAVKTTPLLTVEEGLQAMKKAAKSRGKYKAPR